MAHTIHWHEGLFLQPHHFQRFQHGLLERIGRQRSLLLSYPYGIIHAELSLDDLENMRIRLTSARAIMPSGQEIDFPKSADLPSIDIKQALANSPGGVTVYLGVPVWMDSRANTVEEGHASDPRAKLVYKVAEVQCPDENTGENPRPVMVRRINARLLLENEDRSDIEVLPLVRVARAAGEELGVPRQDPNFCPPCIVLSASPVLKEVVRDLASQVEASRNELQVQMTRGGSYNVETLRGLQIEQLLRLRTLNRFTARLLSLVEAPAVTPFEMYLELRELHAELVALSPDREEFAAPAYNHDNPILPFRKLSAAIRACLRGSVAASFMKVPFTLDENGYLSAVFTDEHFTAPNDYFLGIKTKEDPRALAAFVEDPDGFKFMPKSLAARAVWGVRLKEERFQPLELPAQSDLRYFRLLRSESQRVWTQIQAEKAAIIRWIGKDDADYEMTLYMTASPSNAPR